MEPGGRGDLGPRTREGDGDSHTREWFAEVGDAAVRRCFHSDRPLPEYPIVRGATGDGRARIYSYSWWHEDECARDLRGWRCPGPCLPSGDHGCGLGVYGCHGCRAIPGAPGIKSRARCLVGALLAAPVWWCEGKRVR